MKAYDLIIEIRDRIKELIPDFGGRVFIEMHEAKSDSFPYAQVFHVNALPKDDIAETFDTSDFISGQTGDAGTKTHMVDITVLAVSTDSAPPGKVAEDLSNQIAPLINTSLAVGQQVVSTAFITGELREEGERFPGLSKSVWRASVTYAITVQER